MPKSRNNYILNTMLYLALAVLILLNFLNHRRVYHRYTSPDNSFTAEATYHAYLSFIPMMPGSSGDKPGYIEIFNRQRKSLGRIPVTMVSQANGLEWETEGPETIGANIKGAGEWNFVKKICYYWDKKNNKIYIMGKG